MLPGAQGRCMLLVRGRVGPVCGASEHSAQVFCQGLLRRWQRWLGMWVQLPVPTPYGVIVPA